MVPSFTMNGGGSGGTGSAPAWAGYLGKCEDPPAPPQTCPWCEAKGQTVNLRTYLINLHETIRLCPSPMCIFPLVSRPLDVVLASLSRPSSSPSPTTPLPAQPQSDHHTPLSPDCPEVLTPPAKRPRTQEPYVQEPCALKLSNGSADDTQRQNGFGEGETHIAHDSQDDDCMIIEARASPRKRDDEYDEDRRGDGFSRTEGCVSGEEMETSCVGNSSSAERGGGEDCHTLPTCPTLHAHTVGTCASSSSGPELLLRSDIRTPVKKPAQQEPSGVSVETETTTTTAVECPVARGGGSLKGVSDHLESSSSSSSSSSSGAYDTVTGAAVAMEEECPGSRRRAAKNTDELQASTAVMTMAELSAAAAVDESYSSNAPGLPQPSEASFTSAIPGTKTVARAECHSAADSSLLKSTTDSQSSVAAVGEVAVGKLSADGLKGDLKPYDPSAVVGGLSGKLQADGINCDLQSADPSAAVGGLAGKLQADGVKFGLLQSSELSSDAKLQSFSSSTSSSSSSNTDQKLSPTGDASWLDAMLVALCQCRALAAPRDIKRRRGGRKRKGAERTEPHVMELCSRYHSTSAALQPDRETEADLLRDVEMKLSELRSSAQQLLQKPLQLRLELTRRTEASPALSLPVLLDQDEQAKDVFQHSVSWESQCYACGCSSDSRCSNTVTVHAYLLSGFHPLSAPVQITCSRCQTNLQKKILKESLPMVFAVHFDDGLAEDVVTSCSFGPTDAPYIATVVIEHRRPENVFVSWSRQRDGSWRAYRDFTDVRGTPHPKLDIRAKDIHLVFWEVEPKDPPKPAARKSAKVPVTARRRREQKVSSSLDSQTEEEPPLSILLSKPQRATPSSLPSQAGVKPALSLLRHTVEDGATPVAGIKVKEASLLAGHETGDDDDDHTPLSLVQEALSLSRRTSEEAANVPVEEDVNVPLSSDSPMEDEVISLCDSHTVKKAPLLPARHEQELSPSFPACHSVETPCLSGNTENKSSSLQNRDMQNKVPAVQDQPTKDVSLLSLHCQSTAEESMEETLPSDDLTLSYPHEDTFAEALRPGDPNASAMDTSIGSSTLLETFEGLSHNDIISLTTETASGKARGGTTWTALQNSAAAARTGDPSGVSRVDRKRRPTGGSEDGHVDTPCSPHLVRRSRRLEVKREHEEEEEKKHEQDTKNSGHEGAEPVQEAVHCSTRKVTPQKQTPKKPVVCLRPLSLSAQTLASHSNTVLIPEDHTYTTAADAAVGSGQGPNGEQNMPFPSGPVISPVVDKSMPGRTLNRQNSTGTLQQQPPPPQHSSQQASNAGLKTPTRQAVKCVVVLSPLEQKKILLQMLEKDRDAHNAPTTISEVSLISPPKQKVVLLSPTTPKPMSPIVIPASTPTASKVPVHNLRTPRSTNVGPPNAPLLSPTTPGSKPLPQTPPVKKVPVRQKTPTKKGKVCETPHNIHVTLAKPTAQSPAKQGPLLSPESLGMHKPEVHTTPTVHNETAKPAAVQNPAVSMDVTQSLPVHSSDTQIQTPTETQPAYVMHTPEKTGTVNETPPMSSPQPIPVQNGREQNPLVQAPQPLPIQNAVQPPPQILPVQNSVQPPEQTQLDENSHQQNLPLKPLHTPSAQSADTHNPLLQPLPTISSLQNPYDQTTMDTLPPDTIITLNLDIEMEPPTDTTEPSEHPPESAATVTQNQNAMASQNPTPPTASLTASLPPCPSTASDPKQILQSLQYPTFMENLMPLPSLTEASAVQTPGLQTPPSQPTQLMSVPPMQTTATTDRLQSPTTQATPADSWSAHEDTEIPLNLDTEMDFAEQNETDEDEADESDLILPSIVKPHPQLTVPPKSATVDTSTSQPPISPAPTSSPASSVSSSVSHKSKPSPPPNQPSTKQQQQQQSSVAVSKEKEASSKAPTLPKVTLQHARDGATSARPNMFSGFKFHQPSAPGDELALSGATGPTTLLNGFVSRQPGSKPSVPLPHPSLPSHAPAPKPNASVAKMAAKSSSSPSLTGLAALVGGKKPGSLLTGAGLTGEKTSPPGGLEDSKSAAMRLKLLKKLKAKKKQLAKLDRMMQQHGGGGASQSHSAPPSVRGNSFYSSTDTSPTGSTHLLSPAAASTTTPSPASSDGTEILEMLAGGGGGGVDSLMGVPERPHNHNVASGPHHTAVTVAPAGGGSDFSYVDDFLDDVIFDTSVGAEKEVENADFDSLDMFF